MGDSVSLHIRHRADFPLRQRFSSFLKLLHFNKVPHVSVTLPTIKFSCYLITNFATVMNIQYVTSKRVMTHRLKMASLGSFCTSQCPRSTAP